MVDHACLSCEQDLHTTDVDADQGGVWSEDKNLLAVCGRKQLHSLLANSALSVGDGVSDRAAAHRGVVTPSCKPLLEPAGRAGDGGQGSPSPGLAEMLTIYLHLCSRWHILW